MFNEVSKKRFYSDLAIGAVLLFGFFYGGDETGLIDFIKVE